MRARVGVDIINYATKYVTKIKAKFSYSEQMKFNEPVLKPGIPEKHYLLTVNGFQLEN